MAALALLALGLCACSEESGAPVPVAPTAPSETSAAVSSATSTTVISPSLETEERDGVLDVSPIFSAWALGSGGSYLGECPEDVLGMQVDPTMGWCSIFRGENADGSLTFWMAVPTAGEPSSALRVEERSSGWVVAEVYDMGEPGPIGIAAPEWVDVVPPEAR